MQDTEVQGAGSLQVSKCTRPRTNLERNVGRGLERNFEVAPDREEEDAAHGRVVIFVLVPDDRLEVAGDLEYHVAVTFAYVGNNLEQTQKYQEAV